MTVSSANVNRVALGIKLPSNGYRRIFPEEFSENIHREPKTVNLRAIIPSKSWDLDEHQSESTSPQTLWNCSPPEKGHGLSFLEIVSPQPRFEMNAAAIKLQKVYKSYRTRRNLADCAVIIEELWWKALDFESLKRCSISFFNGDKPETVVSRWARALTRAAKVGKGLSKSDNGQKLALQHWLEAIDPRHRYGHNLQFYYNVWSESESTQPFFYWLDIGDGKEFNLEICSRIILRQQCIKYLGPKERETYEVIIKDGIFVYRQTELPVHTTNNAKWIFVLSTYNTLYVGQKDKGKFQHSSFLAGGATTAAGRLVVKYGFLKAVWPHSGHYLTTEQNFKELISFLEERNVDLTDVMKHSTDDDDQCLDHSSSFKMFRNEEVMKMTMETKEANSMSKLEKLSDTQITEEVANLSSKAEFDDRNSMSKPLLVESTEPISRTWTTGNGPRIGCMREYPSDLQCKALEQVILLPTTPSTWTKAPIPSPRPSPHVRVSPQLTQMCTRAPRVTLTLSNSKKRT